MSWSRNQRSSNPDEHDPLAQNLHPQRSERSNDQTQPLDGNAAIYDQDTVIDSNFSNRSETRRQRQMRAPFNTQRLGTWAADPDNSRKLLTIAAAIVIFLVIIAGLSIANRNNQAATADDDTTLGSAPAFPDPATDASAPAATGSVPGFEFQTVQPIPDTNPAQQPAATGGAFVVTGTATEGLFLRPEPNTNGAPIATLPEGTRVQATGNTQNDGTREWREITSDLGNGWVASDFLQPAP